MAKKRKRAARKTERPLGHPRRTVPNPDTVVAEFTLNAPDGQTYRVLRTTQQDEYEESSRSKKTANGGIMVIENIDLTVEGRPGDDVQIWYRGDRDLEEGDPAPIIYTGRIGSNGRVIVSVPRAYLVLGRPVRRGGTPLSLHDEAASAKTVQLPPAGD